MPTRTKNQKRKKGRKGKADPVSQLLKLSQDTAAEMMAADGDDSFDILLFQFALLDFVQGLPCRKHDFEPPFDRQWVRLLSIIWTSKHNLSTIRVRAVGRIKESSISCSNHHVLYKIAPYLFQITALRARDNIVTLHVRDFDCVKHGTSAMNPPSFEDVFQAFSKAGFWKQSLRKLLVFHCHMSPSGDTFELEGEYPEDLEELVVGYPYNQGGIESSTIYKVSSRSPRLRKLVTGGSGGSEMMTMTKGAMHYLCDILSRVNTIGNQICLYYLADGEFARILKALTSGHSHPLQYYPKMDSTSELRDKEIGCGKYHNMTPEQICRRHTLLKFCFRVNHYRGIFGDRSVPKGLAPIVLEHCQRKSDGQANALFFYLLRERVDWIVGSRSS